MNAEFQALVNNHTWTLTTPPHIMIAICCKWVFRIKENPDGSTNKYKARLVAKGFHQQYSFDFNETFFPVVKPITVRVILTIAITKGWYITQLDLNNVFINGIL